jgi:UDP-N-acetylmuramate--alanine ligase
MSIITPHLKAVLEAFTATFTIQPKDGGLLVVWGEEAGRGKIMAAGSLPREAVTYGWGMGWTWGAFDVKHNHGGGVSFSIAHKGVHIDDMELSVSGDHNILNAWPLCSQPTLWGFPSHDQENPERNQGPNKSLQELGQKNGVEFMTITDTIPGISRHP